MEKIYRELVHELSGQLQTAHKIVLGLIECYEADSVTTVVLLKAAAIPHVRQSEALSVLDLLSRFKVIQKDCDVWNCACSMEELKAIGYILLGALTYKGFSDDIIAQEKSEVVLTRPRAPSQLDKAIIDDTSLSVHVENTDDAFASIAASAKNRLTIMTPFLDEMGASWAIALFNVAKDTVSKELILRFLQDPSSNLYPEGLPAILADLKRLGVKVYDFAVPRPDTPQFYETFHAKVICADGNRAYVGSANLSRHSKETSMEMGMLVSGTVARRVDAVLQTVRGIAISE